MSAGRAHEWKILGNAVFSAVQACGTCQLGTVHTAPKTALKDMFLTLRHIFLTIQKLVPFFSVGSPTFKNTLRQPLR